jgi:hypothetical protein
MAPTTRSQTVVAELLAAVPMSQEDGHDGLRTALAFVAAADDVDHL